MRPYKNLERTLDAIKKRLKNRTIQFVIGGKIDSRFYPAVARKVGELHLEDSVVFLDYVHEDDLPYLYSEAKLLIFPSLYEGFGSPPLEAMACGCPVIVSRAASLPEVCGDAAYYVDPLSVDSIALGISLFWRTRISKKHLFRRAWSSLSFSVGKNRPRNILSFLKMWRNADCSNSHNCLF